MAFRLPKTNYLPPNFSPTLTETTTDSKQNHLITTHNVETNVAIRTPQVNYSTLLSIIFSFGYYMLGLLHI